MRRIYSEAIVRARVRMLSFACQPETAADVVIVRSRAHRAVFFAVYCLPVGIVSARSLS